MLSLVIYDIRSDKSRRKIAKRLLDLGMIRAQLSVFLGTVERNRLDEIALYAEELLLESDRLYILPITRDNLGNARIVGQGFDEALVADEVLTKVI